MTRRGTARAVTQVRMEPSVLAKLKIIASAQHRSMNNQIEYYLAMGIKSYEEEFGPVVVPEENEEE